MKNLTLVTAIKLGFDFENFDTDNTVDELNQAILEFLAENSDKLPKLRDFCEVSQAGHSQTVSYRNYSCSGEIIDYSAYRFQKKQRIYHSEFLHIDEKTGKCYSMNLYCYSK